MPVAAFEQDEALRAGQTALQRAAWQEARAHFEAALAGGETPEALEGLGAASWWLSEVSTVFSARERAYRLYRESKEDRGAARVATALAIDYCTFRGRAAIASGWVWRAERLLGGETCREFGWLLIVSYDPYNGRNGVRHDNECVGSPESRGVAKGPSGHHPPA